VYLGGTVDGRNISSDGSKLDNIISNAITETEVNNLIDAKADQATTVTGTATFTNLTNSISLTGIGSIGLEIGDVVQVTGTASNNKLFTVEVITDANNIIVNQAHAGGTTSKSLVNETVSAAVTLVAKWFNAPIGLGQGWVDVSSSRSEGVTYTNTTGRPFQITAKGSSNAGNQKFFVDGLLMSRLDNTFDEQRISPIIRPGGTYLRQSGWMPNTNIFLELR
jgi:hypothetical protein